MVTGTAYGDTTHYLILQGYLIHYDPQAGIKSQGGVDRGGWVNSL